MGVFTTADMNVSGVAALQQSPQKGHNLRFNTADFKWWKKYRESQPRSWEGDFVKRDATIETFTLLGNSL